MNTINITAHGGGLAKTLNEIDFLIASLRRKLAELDEGRLRLEMMRKLYESSRGVCDKWKRL